MANVNVLNFMSNVDGDSWVHKLDPRTKVAILMFFSILPLLFSDPWFILAFILLTIPMWLTAKLNFQSLLGPLSATGIFLVFIFLFSMFRAGPEGRAAIDALDPSNQGWSVTLGPMLVSSYTVTRALYIAGRLVVPLTIGLLLVSTTDPTYMAKGLRKLKMPINVVFMVLASLRFVPIVTEQLFNIMDAQTMRGVGRSRWQRFKLLILPLFISSMRRTRIMGLACEAKGFGAHVWNNFYEEIVFNRTDKFLLLVLSLMSIIVLVIRFYFDLGTGYVIGH